jgi:flagellar biosynthesis/type III secretory pathway protein FliH
MRSRSARAVGMYEHGAERAAEKREPDCHFVFLSLPGDPTREIEDEMDLHTTPLLSKWSKERIAQGRAQGKREGLERGLQQGRRDGRQEGRRQALLLVLRSRGLEPTAAQLRSIESCTSSRQLDAWLRRAAAAESVAQLLSRRAIP